MLTIAKPRGERVSEVDTDLVERLAAASGVVLRNLRLDAELGQRLVDLEASRRRLVSRRTMHGVGSRLIWRAAPEPSCSRAGPADGAGGRRVDADAAPKTALLPTHWPRPQTVRWERWPGWLRASIRRGWPPMAWWRR